MMDNYSVQFYRAVVHLVPHFVIYVITIYFVHY